MTLFQLLGILAFCIASVQSSNSTGLTNAVTWDPHSLSIQGQRIFILSAEFHPWRLPGNPDLWADIFQKIKANGFNAVSFYVNWALHYPSPGTNGTAGDFQVGTYRDIQRFIDEAKDAGLWLIARPGPYINAETTGGGFPGWVGNIAGSLRANNANYTQAWTPYLTSITKIIARNQITNGGPIILVQAENEYSASASNDIYMQAIIDLYRANGIVVPITFNDQHAGQAGNFSPDKAGTHVDIYCGDSYPQGANSWAQVQAVYYSNHEAAAPSNPLCLAEVRPTFVVHFDSSWLLLGWGSVARGGTGYEKYCGLTDATFGKYYSITVLSLNNSTVQKTSYQTVLFGGTNWGQTLEPTVYSSYDYGGGINEARVATPKMNEMRLQGLFLRVSRDLLGATLIANGTNYTTSTLIHTAELRNLNTNAGFYFVRHDTSTSTALTTTRLTIGTSIGSVVVPLNGAITLNGARAKLSIDANDYIIIYAPSGQMGETAFELASPTIDLSSFPNISSQFKNGLLTLNYNVSGIQIIPIQNGNNTLFTMIMDKATANTWHAPIINNLSSSFGNFFSVGTNNSILVGGPYVLRTASISGNTLSLAGDLNGTTTVQAIVPKNVTQLIWNNAPVQALTGSAGVHLLSASVAGASSSILLPSLVNWKVSGSLPEIDPNFDDSGFVTASLTTTNYTNLPPLAGNVVLYSQQYGFYGGNLIFRGHFNASGLETAIVTTVQSGFAGGYSAWLNGVFLGSSQGTPTISLTTDTWNITSGMLRVRSNNVFVILQGNLSPCYSRIVETSTSSGKEPRGIRGFQIIGVTPHSIYGNFKVIKYGGAAGTPDTFRGYLNEGGLYAERIGAHLPGFPDASWANGTPLLAASIPAGVDMPVRLSITPSVISSNFRVQIYLNGWQVGKYINNIGILRRQSTNTLALSVWSLDASGASIAAFQFNDYQTPDYVVQQGLRPAAVFSQQCD
ncbi:glycoside hydrolase family 35 protein [Pholiota molesta]|nr:glycoside hydrolase family 35 protein [Pholiota molesta]